MMEVLLASRIHGISGRIPIEYLNGEVVQKTNMLGCRKQKS